MTYTLRFNLGRFTCLALRDGSRTSTMHHEIVDVPLAQIDAAMHRLGLPMEPVEVGYNVLFVDTGTHRVLVDTGTGRGELLAALGAEGIQPKQIDRIILTHGDGDHVGGLLDTAGNPVFVNARYVLWREAHAQWTDPVRRAHMIDQLIPLFRRRGVDKGQLARMAESRAAYGSVTLPRLEGRLDLMDLEEEFLPGMRLVDGVGHRSDHVAVFVEIGDASLLHVVDAVRHPVQMAHSDWNGALDSFPDLCAHTRRRLLHRAAQSNALLFAAHLPFPGLGRVSPDGQEWAWRPWGA